MESLSMGLSLFPSLLNLLETPKPIPIAKSIFSSSNSPLNLNLNPNFSSLLRNSLQTHLLSSNQTPSSKILDSKRALLSSHLGFLFLGLTSPLSCLASETSVPTEQLPNKINLEAILVSIDDFFSRYPFFVAGVTFIWLVVIPLSQEYFQKYKFITSIDAFRKLRDEPNCQLLDIRDSKSLAYLDSPNLRILNKNVLQIEFREGGERDFLKKVLDRVENPEDTTMCVIDNFDGNSIKVAELLVKNGLKEAYAIRGGIRGKKGWQEIQDPLLPPSVHVLPKKSSASQQLDSNGGITLPREDGTQSTLSEDKNNGYVKRSIEPTSRAKSGYRSTSPYPNYPDLKPPSSPTPSKPQS